jgi:hypothetical protein
LKHAIHKKEMGWQLPIKQKVFPNDRLRPEADNPGSWCLGGLAAFSGVSSRVYRVEGSMANSKSIVVVFLLRTSLNVAPDRWRVYARYSLHNVALLTQASAVA